MNKYDGLIFDLDGTMWDSTEPIVEAWNIILQKHPEIKRDPIVKSDLTDCMGKTMYTIAAMLFPNEEESVRNGLMDELCLYENEYLAKVGGKLYDKLETTLNKLSQKYPLYIVSNCQDGYIEAFLKAHNLSGLFKDTECWGRTFVTKGETNKILIKRNNLQNPIYIGDTQGDKQSAIDAGIDFVFASYGFGNVDEYTYKIEKFSDLLDIL